MAGIIWAMKSGDTTATQYSGTSGGLTSALSYVGSNGHITLFPGTEDLTFPAIPTGVTIDRITQGIKVMGGNSAFRGRPWHDVRAYGATGDGTTNDTAAVQAAINAATTDSSYSVLFPAGTYKITDGGLTCKRETWLIGQGNAKLTMSHASNTMVTWVSDANSGGQGGGARGLKFSGAAGSSTSKGCVFGSTVSTDYAHRLSLIDCEVSDFGHGIVIEGDGTSANGENSSTDGFLIRRCEIYANIYNGILVNAKFPIEINYISECHFHNNGTGQATGAAIQLSASGGGGSPAKATGALRAAIHSCTFNVNGQLGSGLGVIHCPVNAYMELQMFGCTFETQTASQQCIVALSEGSLTYNYPRSRIILTNCWLTQFDTGSTYGELIHMAGGELQCSDTKFWCRAPADFTVAGCTTTTGPANAIVTTSNNFITAGVRPGMPISGTNIAANSYVKTVDSTTQITLNQNTTGAGSGITMSFTALVAAIRAGHASYTTAITLVGCLFKGTGTAANRRCLNLTPGTSSTTFFNSVASVFDGFSTAAALLMNGPGCHGQGDLWQAPTIDFRVGSGNTLRNVSLQSATDPDMRIALDVAKVGSYGMSAQFFSMAGYGAGLIVPVVPSGSIAAAGAANNGMLVIEDVGDGDRNLVFYAAGQRFRIDGGANV